MLKVFLCKQTKMSFCFPLSRPPSVVLSIFLFIHCFFISAIREDKAVSLWSLLSLKNSNYNQGVKQATIKDQINQSREDMHYHHTNTQVHVPSYHGLRAECGSVGGLSWKHDGFGHDRVHLSPLVRRAGGYFLCRG